MPPNVNKRNFSEDQVDKLKTKRQRGDDSGVDSSNMISNKNSLDETKLKCEIQNKDENKNNNSTTFMEFYSLLKNVSFEARVTKKHTIQSNVQGDYFNIDLIDQSCEVRCFIRTNNIEQLNSKIQEGNIYIFKNFFIHKPNKMYNHLEGPFELVYGDDSLIEDKQSNNSRIPTHKFSLKSLIELESVASNTLIDVAGIIKDVNNVEEVGRDKSLKKRTCYLGDAINNEIEVTFWNAHALQCPVAINDVVIFKGVKMNEFRGKKSLSVIKNTQILVNNVICEETQRLKDYVDNENNVKLI